MLFKNAFRHRLRTALTIVGLLVAICAFGLLRTIVDAWYAGEALKLATLTEHHVHQELEGSLARLAASAGGSPEVLALTAARGVAEDETAEVRQQQSAARLALQRWVGVPGGLGIDAATLKIVTISGWLRMRCRNRAAPGSTPLSR
jgi:hypothetical protein